MLSNLQNVYLAMAEKSYLGLLDLHAEEEQVQQEQREQQKQQQKQQEQRENNVDNDDLLERLNGNQSIYKLHDNHKLDISLLDEITCISLFRFTYEEIQRIGRALDLPEIIRFKEGTRQSFTVNRAKALAIMLRRLAYPSTLNDLKRLFGINQSTLCTVFNEMIVRLYDTFHEGVKYNKQHFNRFNLKKFDQAVTSKGACFSNVVGFMGGTLYATCRPLEYKRAVYDRKNRQHGLKYQSIVTPDGMTASLCGPYAGSVDDQDMLDQSNVVEKLTKDLNFVAENGEELYRIYGNPTYKKEVVLIPPFKTNAKITEEEKEQNDIMSSLREVVEWEFDHVATLFAFITDKSAQKIFLNRVGLYYIVATLLKNIHVCIRGGSQTLSYFGLQAPTLEEYVEEIKNVDIQ